MHDTVRQAIEAVFRASDPSQYHTYRHLAWRQLRTELDMASKPELWRYTADTIYLIQQPTVRDAFFPNDAHLYAIEAAQPAHRAAVQAITERHDGPASAHVMDCWWQYLSTSFFVVRDSGNNVAGYYTLFRPEDVTNEIRQADPIAQKWWQHLQDQPLPAGQNALFMRRILAAETGEAFSGVQAACWLDVKRAYVADPQLGRMYVLTGHTETYMPILGQLGFRLLPDMQITLDNKVYDSLMLDFGPTSVVGWLAGLVDVRYGSKEPDCRLDIDARELILENQRVGLTPLEFGVMHCLWQRAGRGSRALIYSKRRGATSTMVGAATWSMPLSAHCARNSAPGRPPSRPSPASAIAFEASVNMESRRFSRSGLPI